MAQTPTPVTNTEQPATAAAPVRRRASTGTRAPSGPRTVYAVIQVLDEAGEVLTFDKKRIKLIGLETSADTMLSMVDDNANSFFIRGKLQRRSRIAPSQGAALAGPRAA